MRSHCIVRSHFQWRNQTFKNAENASYMAHKLLISTYLSIKDTLNNCTMFVTLFHRIFACVRSERCGVVKHPQLPQSLNLYIWSSSRAASVNLLPNPLVRFQHNHLRSPTKLACPHCPQGRSGCNQRPVCSRRHHTQCNKLFNSCPWIAIRLYLAMLLISQEEVFFWLQSWSDLRFITILLHIVQIKVSIVQIYSSSFMCLFISNTRADA